MAMKFLQLLFLISFQVRLSFSGQPSMMESVPDLQSSTYMTLDGYPCVQLLNLSGEIGCSNPGREKVVAPIIRLNNATELSQLSAVLLSVEEIQSFLASQVSRPDVRPSTCLLPQGAVGQWGPEWSHVLLEPSFNLSDSSFAKNVAGVLVESRPDLQNQLKGFSPAQKLPQSEFAPYTSINYEWNPPGSGIMWNPYNFPVFLLSQTSTKTMQEAAIKNEKSKKSCTDDVAEFDLVMQTMKSGTHDSKSCLKENTCLPLGGYSVWSSLPPINISSPEQSKPIILALASMDSASFFRDKGVSANSPISGLISLLAAVDALSHTDGLDGFNKRVVEIGSVGKGLNQGVNNFFIHTAGVSSATNETLDAVRRAQDSVKSENITISSANASNPGIPPFSLMTFLRKNSLTSDVVLEDFDTVFTNKFYHSHLDDLSNINLSSIVAAASLVARTLCILASDTKNLSSSGLTSINVNTSLVEELVGCLLDCEPGLSCALVKSYISPANTCPSHYVGVKLDEPSSTPYLGYVGDISRFVWNFLAERTSIPKENASSVCSQDCSNDGEVCIREETEGKGVCVVSTTRYVPAYSTRLKFESGTWTVLPPNNPDPMGLLDAVWTESNWDVIGLRVYNIQNSSFDHLVLLRASPLHSWRTLL